jgi:AraC-like DNA-binding protein
MRPNPSQLWYLPELSDLELLSGCYRQRTFPWHFHDTYCLSLQEQGHETIAFTDQTLHVRPGMILIINPSEAHSNYNLTPAEWRYRSFYVPVALLRSVAGSVGPPPYFPAKLLDDPALFQQLTHVHQQLAAQGFSPANQSLLEQALRTLVRRYGQAAGGGVSPTFERLPHVLALLDQQLGRKLSVAELAATAGLSRFHFMRTFAHATGLTPMAYLTQRRIRAAKQLLQAGASPVEAALETGFCDQSHFARHFQRLVGTTPGQYRTIIQD